MAFIIMGKRGVKSPGELSLDKIRINPEEGSSRWALDANGAPYALV